MPRIRKIDWRNSLCHGYISLVQTDAKAGDRGTSFHAPEKRYGDMVRPVPDFRGIRPDLAGPDPPGHRRRHSRPADRRFDAASLLPDPGREAWRGAGNGRPGIPATGRPGVPGGS